LGSNDRANGRRAWTVGVEQHDRGELPIGQRRRRRRQRRGRRVTDAHNAQNAVVVGVILMPRRWGAIVVGISLTHADTVERIGGLCLRRMGERNDEQDLAPGGEHQGGKTNGA